MKWLSSKLDISAIRFYEMYDFVVYQNIKTIKWGRIPTEIATLLKELDGCILKEVYLNLKNKQILTDKQLLILLNDLVVSDIENNQLNYKEKMVFFLVTRRCNLFCKTCYLSADKVDYGYEMSINEIEKSFRKLSKEGFYNITISGGEPFVRKDIKDIINIAAKYFKKVSINTNGILLTREIVQFLKKNDINVMMSLEGASELINNEIRGKGTFDRIIQVLQYFIEEDYRNLTISITVTRINVDELNLLYDLCSKYGIKMTMGVFLETGRGLCNSDILKLEPKKMLECYLQLLERMCSDHKEEYTFPPLLKKCVNYCGAVYSILNIMPDGNVFPCPNLIEDRWNIGNIISEDYCTILENAIAQNELISRHVEKVSSCIDCSLKYLCGGGCMANAYFEEGSVYAKDPLCDFYKAIYTSYLVNWDSDKDDANNVKGVIDWCMKKYL
ncbi:radical SAM protein [Anaerosporobacter sp.]